MGVSEGGVGSGEVDGVAERGAGARGCEGKSYCKFEFQGEASTMGVRFAMKQGMASWGARWAPNLRDRDLDARGSRGARAKWRPFAYL